MTDLRNTLAGKQVVFTTATTGVAADVLNTLTGKQVIYDNTKDQQTTLIGKQVVWSDTAPPPTPVIPPLVSPTAVPARGGAAYVDSFLEYDGRNVAATDGLFPGAFLTLSGGTNWTPGETLTATTSQAAFVSGDVGNVLILHELDAQGFDTGTVVRFTVKAFSSGTVVTGTTDITVPSDMRSAFIIVWDRAVDQVAGLDHLEGALVSILGDKHIVASVYRPELAQVTVSSGTVSLGDFYSNVVVGLPYLSDLETLDIDRPYGPSAKMARQMTTRAGVMMTASRSFFTGTEPPADDKEDPLDGLYEIIDQQTDTGGGVIAKNPEYEEEITDYRDVNVQSQWDEKGHVFIRSIDPVPCGIGAVFPMGYTPQGET